MVIYAQRWLIKRELTIMGTYPSSAHIYGILNNDVPFLVWAPSGGSSTVVSGKRLDFDNQGLTYPAFSAPFISRSIVLVRH
jgi:hypothetical protein